MSKMIDLTGLTFGRWFVLSIVEGTKYPSIRWNCICTCGNRKEVLGNSLKHGSSESCGCLQKERASMSSRKWLNGLRFGRLVVIELVGKNNHKKLTWRCRCDCGNEVIVAGGNLRSGGTKSCGCYVQDMKERKLDECPQWKGGRWMDKNGYILLYKPDHPSATKAGYLREHIYVMSEFLGRLLTKEESVHHKNGVRDDNRIENLELWSKSHGPGQRVSDLIAYAKEILSKYEPESLSITNRAEYLEHSATQTPHPHSEP